MVAVSAALITIFEEEYRELRPRAPIPGLDIRFRRFTSLNTTIRLREGVLRVRLSDLLESSPESVHRAIAHILLAKLYRKPISASASDRYRRYVSSEAVLRGAEHIPQTRGRKRISSPVGHYYHLEEVFDTLNRRLLLWSVGPSDFDRGQPTPQNGCLGTTTPLTTRLLCHASSTGPTLPDVQSSICSITRCFT